MVTSFSLAIGGNYLHESLRRDFELAYDYVKTALGEEWDVLFHNRDKDFDKLVHEAKIKNTHSASDGPGYEIRFVLDKGHDLEDLDGWHDVANGSLPRSVRAQKTNDEDTVRSILLNSHDDRSMPNTAAYLRFICNVLIPSVRNSCGDGDATDTKVRISGRAGLFPPLIDAVERGMKLELKSGVKSNVTIKTIAEIAKTSSANPLHAPCTNNSIMKKAVAFGAALVDVEELKPFTRHSIPDSQSRNYYVFEGELDDQRMFKKITKGWDVRSFEKKSSCTDAGSKAGISGQGHSGHAVVRSPISGTIE